MFLLTFYFGEKIVKSDISSEYCDHFQLLKLNPSPTHYRLISNIIFLKYLVLAKFFKRNMSTAEVTKNWKRPTNHEEPKMQTKKCACTELSQFLTKQRFTLN